MPVSLLTLGPVAAAVVAAGVATLFKSGPTTISGIRHFAAGVVFAAAAGEILPDVVHGNASAIATFVGGGLGLALMLVVKQTERWIPGPAGLIAAIGVDLLIDGLVLGIAMLAGEKTGLLLAIALTLEVLSLGLVLTTSLEPLLKSPLKVIASIGGLTLLLPLGALLATPASLLPAPMFTGLLALGLVALLYLVTEELLVEAHEVEDTPLITAMFFVGFLALLILEEVMS